MAEEIKTETTEATATPEPPKTTKDLEAEIERLKAENEKQRKSISNANSDAADWKRKYTATLDEAKQKELALEEERKKEREELEALRRDKRVSVYKDKLLEATIDPVSADAMAKALPDGVSDDYFATLKSVLSNQRQAVEAAALNKQPTLSVGMPPTGVQKTELDKKFDAAFGL